MFERFRLWWSFYSHGLLILAKYSKSNWVNWYTNKMELKMPQLTLAKIGIIIQIMIIIPAYTQISIIPCDVQNTDLGWKLLIYWSEKVELLSVNIVYLSMYFKTPHISNICTVWKNTHFHQCNICFLGLELQDEWKNLVFELLPRSNPSVRHMSLEQRKLSNDVVSYLQWILNQKTLKNKVTYYCLFEEQRVNYL